MSRKSWGKIKKNLESFFLNLEKSLKKSQNNFTTILKKSLKKSLKKIIIVKKYKKKVEGLHCLQPKTAALRRS